MVEKGSAHVTMCDSSGESYTGYWDWVMNRPQGRGKWVYPSGDVCEGLFDKGKATGKCVYTFANGDCYRGEMKHGKANGVRKKNWCLFLLSIHFLIIFIKQVRQENILRWVLLRGIFFS